MSSSDEPKFPPLSVVSIEFEIPKRWTNKLIKTAANDPNHPTFLMEKTLRDWMQGDYIRLIGFHITD
jgi:hypothetical protein